MNLDEVRWITYGVTIPIGIMVTWLSIRDYRKRIRLTKELQMLSESLRESLFRLSLSPLNSKQANKQDKGENK